MQPYHPKTTSRGTRSPGPDKHPYYCLPHTDEYSNSVLYQVVPAGRNFFHILEVTSGRIRGFRSGHIKACELARKLETSLHQTHGGFVSSSQ